METMVTKDDTEADALSIFEAANLLGVYPGTLRRWVHAGKIPTVDPMIKTRERRRLRFDREYIESLIVPEETQTA